MTTTTPRTDVVSLTEHPHSQVLVIGGGINGAAVFRDLALQGINVTLIERNDYMSGASAASSHMIHGGIRYLENGEFRLVREAVQERNRLLKTAPHYVKPLQTTIPIFSTFSGIAAAPLRFLTHKQSTTTERGALLIKVGMLLYDSFSRDGGSVPRHQFKGRRKSLADQPELNPNLKYTATYYDAAMSNPERLGLDVLLDGVVAGGRSANYVEAIGTAKSAHAANGVLVRDRLSGEEFVLTADVIVNTTGPWTDLTNDALGTPTTFMGGTKGSHVVLDSPELLAATKGRELFFENDDGRIVLICPIKGRVLLGTTDVDADPRDPMIETDDDTEYFFKLVSHIFPDVKIDRSQIIFTYAGIRPLPRHDDETPGFVSRDYRIEKGSFGGTPLLSLVGGKWTTFRAFGEHMANDVLALLKRQRTTFTTTLAIGGGVGFPTSETARNAWIHAHAADVTRSRVAQLLTRYGTRATDVIAAISAGVDAPLSTTDLYTTAELGYLAQSESVVHLDDVLLRRTDLAFTGAATSELIEEFATVIGETLGWTPERRAHEIDTTRSMLTTMHGIVFSDQPTPVQVAE